MNNSFRRAITAALLCACLALLTGVALMAVTAADKCLRLWVLYEDIGVGLKYHSLGKEGVR